MIRRSLLWVSFDLHGLLLITQVSFVLHPFGSAIVTRNASFSGPFLINLLFMSVHTATHCNTLQHTATHGNTRQHTATHCNTLQHIAPHCTTLSIQIVIKSYLQSLFKEALIHMIISKQCLTL